MSQLRGLVINVLRDKPGLGRPAMPSPPAGAPRNISPGIVRHRTASNLVAQDVDIRKVQKLIGKSRFRWRFTLPILLSGIDWRQSEGYAILTLPEDDAGHSIVQPAPETVSAILKQPETEQ